MKNAAPSYTPFKVAPIAIAVSSALAMMSSTALAAEQSTVELEQIEVVDTAQDGYAVKSAASVKYTQELVDTPQTINIVNEQVLEDQGVTSLEDALRNVAGVSTFGAGEGGGGNVNTTDNVTIRGFDANGSIYSDGIRDVAGYSRDTFNTEQIEVAKGANGTISGKGSAGGSVNLVTKAANLRGDKNSISASYDEGDTARLTGDFNKVLSDDSALRLNLMAEQGGDYWDNGEEEYKSYAIAPSYFTKVSEDTDLTINLMHMKQDNTPVIGLPFITEEVAAATGLPEGMIDEQYWDNYYGVKGLDFSEVEATTLTAILNHSLNKNWAFRNQTRFGVTETQAIITRPWPENTGTRAAPNYTGNYLTTNTKRDFSDNQLAVSQFDFLGELNTGSIRHDLVIGAEIYQEKQTSYDADLSNITRSQSSYDATNPGVTTATGSYSLTKNNVFVGQGLAAYLSNTATINDYVQLSGGVRAERYETEQDTYDAGAFQETLKSDADLLTWRAGINVKPTSNTSIYASVANAQQPYGSDISADRVRGVDAEDVRGSDPISSTTMEIGTKAELFNSKLLLSAAVFETTKDTYDTNDSDELIFGEEESKGFELSATGQLTDTLSITASYTKQDAKVTEDASSSDNVGDGLSSAPDESASVWLSYKGEKLGLGIGAEYTSGNDYWRRSEVYFTTGEVTLVNAMASYAFTENLSAQLNISNLTDERYATDYSAKGHFLPGNPRNVKATVKYDF